MIIIILQNDLCPSKHSAYALLTLIKIQIEIALFREIDTNNLRE